MRHLLLSISILTMLTACGGGSNDNNIINNNVITPDDSTWQTGVFQSENNFKDACQTPRTGTDPFSGQAYPDRQGSTLDENNWLRSWSNNTYLWYNEITDRNPALYTNPIEYFDLLKTNAITPSGNPRDKFHFTRPTSEWQQLTQSGAAAGYGAILSIRSSTPPREIRVAFTEPGSEAENNLLRGTEIIEVDGIDVVNNNTQSGIDIINNGLFPNNNESHTFVVRDIGSSTTRPITMTASIVTSTPVQRVTTFNTAGGSKVGYFLFNSHNQPSEQGLFNAITQLANDNVDELVLDLRYNGGGLLAIASQLAYMVAGNTATNNKTFDRLVFNDKYPTTDPVTGATLSPTPFYNQSLNFSVSSGQSLPSLNLSRVFILSTSDTCSASEAIINGLRGIDIEVILIGSTTCGKPYGFYPTDNCGTTYFTVQFSGENNKGFGDYSDGFSPINTTGPIGLAIPGCAVADDFENSLGDTQENLLEVALSYIDNGNCPASIKTANNAKKEKSDGGLSLFNSKRYQDYILLKQSSFITGNNSQ